MDKVDWVIVSETGQGKFSNKVEVNDYALIADEPKEYGGDAGGPSPYDFLLAGLGACTSMTLRSYADLKKIPLEKTIVKLSHEKIYAKDCENCEEQTSKIDRINRIIELQGNLTAEQREKLLDIANKCPVHRTLTSTVQIKTELAE